MFSKIEADTSNADDLRELSFKMQLEKLVYGGRTADVPHGRPGQGMPAELLGRGMPGTSDDEDGNAGPFSALSCPGNRVHFGGGKPPPPTVYQMGYDGPLSCVERNSTCHRKVHQGVGAEEKVVIRGGIEG